MARGKPSEIDHLNGFVARRGAELGVATPVNQALHALVKLVEAGVMSAPEVAARRARRGCPPRRVRAGPARARPGRRAEPLRGAAADRRRVVRHLAHRHRARPGVRQARAAPSCASRPTGARRSSATATRRAGCSVANAARARLRAAGAGPAPRARRAGDELPAAGRLSPVEAACCATAHADVRDGARGRQRAGAHPRLLGRAARARRRSSTPTRSSSTSASSRTCSRPRGATPTSRPRCERWSRTTQLAPRARWCTATSARRTSWSARTARCCSTPSAPGGATRRSTSRSASTTCCSSACGHPPRRRRFLDCVRTRWPTAYLDAVDWEPRDGARAPRRRAAARPAARARRRQVTGRVHHRRSAARAGAARRRRAAAAIRSSALQRGRERLARGASSDERRRHDPRRRTRAASGTAAAGRPSRPR